MAFLNGWQKTADGVYTTPEHAMMFEAFGPRSGMGYSHRPLKLWEVWMRECGEVYAAHKREAQRVIQSTRTTVRQKNEAREILAMAAARWNEAHLVAGFRPGGIKPE